VRDAHILLHVYTVADRHGEGNTRHASPTCDVMVAYIEPTKLKPDDMAQRPYKYCGLYPVHDLLIEA
jgi:hypothetical protein